MLDILWNETFAVFTIEIEATSHKIPPFTLVNVWGNTLFDDFASINASKPESHIYLKVNRHILPIIDYFKLRGLSPPQGRQKEILLVLL